jgi:hypothetical protein
MRKIILVAAMALTSAAVHAGELRSLSTAAGPNDAPAAIQTKQLQAQNDAPAAKPADAPRYAPPPAETQTPADPARNISDAPRTTMRPAPVDTAPPATASSAPSTAHPERRYDDKGYYDDAGYHPFPRRYAGADRQSDPQSDRTAERPRGYANRPHYRALWSPRRIIAEMHRYGIYW